MIQHLKPRSSNSGFTLIEILVVIVIVAVLSAIAAPGWLGFMNNRRITTARGQIAETIRKTQSDAKTTRTMRAVLIDDTNPTAGGSSVPRIASVRCPAANGDAETCDLTGVNPDWLSLGNGEILPGTFQYTTTTKSQSGAGNTIGQARLVFDANGIVKRNLSGKPATAGIGEFVVGIIARTPQAEPRCLVVQTLLGSVREGNNKTECGD